ncbi:MAG: flippase-like domain-containing protein [Deltaproteobacteria bacterium]|nr:flippase-like domain-containing protein [Deltaproteobacteria bacterium]
MNRINSKGYINWKFWTGLLISALFLYLAFRKVDPAKTWDVIKKSDLSVLFIVVVFLFLQYVIRAWRWHTLLEPIKKTRFSSRLSTILLGFAANCVLPARLGEFVRANYLGNSEKISSSAAFATIVVERFFDGLTLLLILLIGILGTKFPGEYSSIAEKIRHTGIILFIVYIILILLLICFKYKTDLLLKFMGRILFFLPKNILTKIIHITGNFSQGLVLIRGYTGWIKVILYSLLLWLVSIFQIQLVGYSIILDIPLFTACLILAMGSFGVMIPSAPGFIGTFHLAVQYGFILYGIGKEEALSAAIIWHATFFFPTILFGLGALIYFNSLTGFTMKS